MKLQLSDYKITINLQYYKRSFFNQYYSILQSFECSFVIFLLFVWMKD